MLKEIRKHPRVARSIHNLFKPTPSPLSIPDRSASNYRSRVGSASNRLLGDTLLGLKEKSKVSAPILDLPVAREERRDSQDPYLHNAIRSSQGGLKIFQKLSDDQIHRKHSTSLRTSFIKAPQVEDLKTRIVRFLDRIPKQCVPELPKGSKVVISILSNWGDPQQYLAVN